MKNRMQVFLMTVSIFFLLISAFFFYQSLNQSKKVLGETSTTNTNCLYKNINPLRCEPDLAVKKQEYIALRNELTELIAMEKKTDLVTSVSVYFRDLENGPSVSINSQENFTPASLLKLPLMIAYYKKAEKEPTLLQKKLRVGNNVQSLSQNITSEKSAKEGNTYTIDELITILIQGSDNTAWQVLFSYLEKSYSKEGFIYTLSDLGIIDPSVSTDEQYITVQSYAAIFRMLYNSSYLNSEMSDKALSLLKSTNYNDGIVAGIPNGTQVAHKFGERNNQNEYQLHDCGIVYYEKNPYLLCIMTRGKNMEMLAPVIKTISEKVYKEVEKRNEKE